MCRLSDIESTLAAGQMLSNEEGRYLLSLVVGLEVHQDWAEMRLSEYRRAAEAACEEPEEATELDDGD